MTPFNMRLVVLFLLLRCRWWLVQGQETSDFNTDSSAAIPGHTEDRMDGESNCPLICFNGSTCKPGNADFSDHPKDSQGNELDIHSTSKDSQYHCDCQEGFTGVTCQIPFESCKDDSLEHVCYHGGTCVTGQEDSFGNDQYHCDCTDAVSENQRHVGKYCEFAEETVCREDLGTFCVNNGVCVQDPDPGVSPCKCPGEFAGIHCEYRKDEVPGCDLECQNGGTCQNGISPFSDDLKYCLCPPTVHGGLCEKENDVPCGADTCYHGGKCVERDDGTLYCDCSATDDPNRHFAGSFCEYEAAFYCDDAKRYFCANGGTCEDQGNGIFGCKCPEGWGGPSCEFESDNPDQEFEKCDLECYNGGECRKGVNSITTGLGPELSHLADEARGDYDMEYCVCPSGFTGAKCQHKYEECGNGEHMCVHGTKCVPPFDPENSVWTCECDEAFREDHNYNGGFCQHHRTTMCATDDSTSGLYEGILSVVFCVNDGVCTEIEVDGGKYPGCKCPEPFTGVHCELLKSKRHQFGAPLANDANDIVAVYAVVALLGVLLVVGGIFGFHAYRNTRARRNDMVQTAHFQDNPAKSPNMEEVDFDDEHVMEDIDLL